MSIEKVSLKNLLPYDGEVFYMNDFLNRERSAILFHGLDNSILWKPLINERSRSKILAAPITKNKENNWPSYQSYV
jgi:hypothetical protein